MAGSKKIVDAYVELSARGINAVEGGLHRVESAARSAHGGLMSMAAVAGGNILANAFSAVVNAAASIPSAMISSNAAFETASVGMEVLLGSVEKAHQRIAELTEFAAKTPYEMPGILQASKQLEMANIPAKDHMAILKMTGDMASAAGKEIGDVGMWVSRAYGAIQGGKPWGEAAQALSEMGVLSIDARSKLEAMEKSGAKGPEIWEAFRKAMGRFDGMMEKQAGTFSGLMSTMSDGFREVMKVVGGPVFDVAKNAIEGIVEAISSDAVVSGAEAIADGMRSAFGSIATLAEPILPVLDAVWAGMQRIGGVLAGFAGIVDGVTAPLYAVWELVGQVFSSIFEAINELGEMMQGTLGSALEGVGLSFQGIGEFADTVFTAITEAVYVVTDAVANWRDGLQYVLDVTSELQATVGGFFASLAETIWSGVVAAVGAFGIELGSAGETADYVFSTMQGWIDAIAAGFRNWDLSLQYAWLHLQNFGANAYAVLQAVGENIAIVFKNFPAFVEAGVQAAVTILGNLATNVQIAFQWVFDWIASWFEGGGGWGDAIASAVQAVWDGVSWLIDQVWSGLEKLWNAVTSGFTKGLDIASANYADGIRNSKDENGKPELNFIPITQGVEEAFKDLPELVKPEIKDARERFGSELDQLDREWNQREQKRNQLAPWATGPENNDGKGFMGGEGDTEFGSGRAAGKGKGGESTGDGDSVTKKRDKAGDLIGADQMWARIQKAAMETKETKKQENLLADANKQREETNMHLKKIAENHPVAAFAG